jgi:hypothetical protein
MIVLGRWPGDVETWRLGKQIRGTWFPHPLGSFPMPGEWTHEGRRVVVYVACPTCGRSLVLSSTTHAIAPDGRISPSLVCGYAHLGCAWHVFARLEGW